VAFDDPRLLFGARVRELRLSLGLTQKELAERSGLHHTYISSVEMGERNVSLVNITRLAAALGVDPPQLLGPLRRS
jgi:transcriptional regulator with XRE-family HTH domain